MPLEAWSTSDLVVERNRVRSVLDHAPPDRSADLAALDRSRREAESKVQATRRSVAQLESRKRPRKERRLPDVTLLTQRHNLAHFEQQASRLDREIAGLHASQHRRASHLTAHGADRIELDAISEVLDKRVREQTNRAVGDPPGYITRILGPRPASGANDRAWVSAVVAIERYRVENDITDRRTAIGPEPDEYGHALDWYRVSETIIDALDVISPPSRTIQSTVLTIEAPSLDIGL